MTLEDKSVEDRPKPEDFLGSFRTFGETGPLYEVVAKLDAENILIRVVHSGEEVEYPLDALANDPLAR